MGRPGLGTQNCIQFSWGFVSKKVPIRFSVHFFYFLFISFLSFSLIYIPCSLFFCTDCMVSKVISSVLTLHMVNRMRCCSPWRSTRWMQLKFLKSDCNLLRLTTPILECSVLLQLIHEQNDSGTRIVALLQTHGSSKVY